MTCPPRDLTARPAADGARQGGPRRRGRLRVAAVAATVLAVGAGLLAAAPAQAKKKDEPRAIVSGWLPYWTTAASIASMTENADLLQEVSPFWYTLRLSANGKQAVIGSNVSSTDLAAVKTVAAQVGVPLWPSFTDSLPAGGLSKIMGKPKKRTKLVDRIVANTVANGFAGVDLDLEKFAFSDGSSSWATTKPRWVAFVAQLGAALHAEGLKLSATTPPLCDMAGSCGPTKGYWVYAWKEIGPYIDRLRVMAYDYSWSSPGPIGPYPWTEAIVRYAVTQVPSGKVQIGVPTYGRDWVARKANGKYDASAGCSSSILTSRSTFDAVTVPSRLAAAGLSAADVQWDDTMKESFYTYRKTYSSSCTVTRVAWYGDARAVAARAALVAKYQIAGIVTWTIGGEDPAQWDRLRAYAKGIAPAPTGARASAPEKVTYGQRARVSVSTQSQGLPVAGASAVLEWKSASGGGWQRLATGTTSSAGTATWSPVVTASGTYRVRVAGAWDRESATARASVTVRPVLRPTATTVSVGSSGRAKLKSRVTPYAGQRVVVQRQSGGGWHAYATARIGGAGKAKAKVGVGTYRFVAKASARTARAVSSAVRVG